jgi:hypothetical protein
MRAFHYWALSSLVLSGCYLFHRAPTEDASPASDPPSEAGLPVRDAGSADPERVLRPTRCTLRTLRAGEMFSPVDMVWVVDSSRSMADERQRIEQIMNQFVSDAESRQFDVHLIMVTRTNIVPPPLGTDSARYRFVERNVASHEPLQALIEEFPRYGDFLRSDAALHFVIVTDDDSAMSAGEFRRQMDRRVGRPYVVHAVASPDVDGQPCRTTQQCRDTGRRAGAVCGASAIGREYWELASELGGEEISVCTQDWSKVFGPLLEAVTPTAIPCSIDLPPDVALEATQVALRVEETKQPLTLVAGITGCATHPAAYYYVDREAGPELTLCPAACTATDAPGVELEIATHCE